jgi:hypothetical protein
MAPSRRATLDASSVRRRASLASNDARRVASLRDLASVAARVADRFSGLAPDDARRDRRSDPRASRAARSCTPAQLANVFQIELDAIATLEQAEAKRQKARLDERKAYKNNRPMHAALELFVRGAFADAVHLGHFGYAPEKSRKTSVQTTVQALAKAKATREAHGTKGPKQKRRIRG